MSWIHGWRHRLKVWISPRDYAAELAEERAFHMEMHASGGRGDDDGRAPEPQTGPYASPDGPRRSGRRAAGLETWVHDLRYAVRGLTRAPGFTAIALTTLALGVGANAAVFSMLDRLFNQPPVGVRDSSGLRRLYQQFPNHPLQPGLIFAPWNYLAYTAVEGTADGAYDLAAWTPSGERGLQQGDAEVTVRTSFVSHDFFSLLGVGAQRGRIFGADEARVDVPAPVAVLTSAAWERLFGFDPDVVGRTIEIDGVDYTVIGVLDDGFVGLELTYADIFFPLSALPVAPQQGVPWYEGMGAYVRVVARVAPGIDDSQISERATAGYLRRALPPGARPTIDSADVVLAGSIIETRGIGRDTGGPDRGQAVSISMRMIGVSAILLLIACANVASLLLVRATRRRREMAMRLALGVSRLRLGVQLLTEGMLLALAGGTAAMVVAVFGGRVLRRLLLPEVQWADAALEPRTLGFAIGTAALVGLLAGLAPAFHARTVDINTSLKAGSKGSGSARSRLRSTLVAAQAALSIVLLVGAGLFITSLGNAMSIRLGFDMDGVAFVRNLNPAPGATDHEQTVTGIAERLAGAPGVLGSAVAFAPPMMGNGCQRALVRDRSEAEAIDPEVEFTRCPSMYNRVSSSYFAVAGVRILEGRVFAEGETGVAVVDEAMAQAYWPGRNALGQCLVLGRSNGDCVEVIGIVEDQRDARVIEESTNQYFLPLDPTGPMLARSVMLRVDPGQWNQVRATALEEVSGRFNARTVRVDRMSDALESQFRPWRVGAQLFVVFGVLALLITAIGVYGVMAYAVSQRTHEMGVRFALGAELRDILELVLSDGLKIVGIGAVLGIASALALGRLIESLLYGATPRDPMPMVVAAAVLLVAGAVASLVPALRAGRVDPAEVLRQE